AAQQLLPLPLRPRPQLLPQRWPVLPGGEPRGLLPVQHAGLHMAQGDTLRGHRHRLPGAVRGRGLGRPRGAPALHAHRLLRQEALPAQDGEQQTAQDQIPHPVRAAQRQLLPLHHRRGLPPKRRPQRSPQAAGLPEILPEGRGALQHPQRHVAQARQRGAGRGGAELPAEQPDVSWGGTK
ncbi:chondroitin sulfate proteoglycan 5 (neuroglycan C), partial [Columba livia]